MELASGHRGVKLEGKEEENQKNNWKGYTNGLVRLQPGGWLYPADYLLFADKLFNFQFCTDDVVVMTWPKCGTTWTQEIVWTMRNSPNLDHLEHGTSINNRVPFLDTDMFLSSSLLPPPNPESSSAKQFSRLCPDKNPADGFFLQLCEALERPRTIKTHLPLSLFAPSLLKTAKVIYVARHPNDVLISYYHHVQLFKSISYVGTFDQFVEYFLSDDLVYGPYWLHIKEAWEQKDNPNMHFIFYEDMKSNITSELEKLNTFLGTDLSQDQLEKVRHYASFEEMKRRDNVFKEIDEEDVFTHSEYAKQHGGFYRKGETGTWKYKLSPEQNQRLDAWMEEHLTPTGITFKERK